MAEKKKVGFAAHPEYINRKGRPTKGMSISDNIRKILNEKDPNQKKKYIEIFAENVVMRAIEGDQTCIKILMHYIDGLPVQKMDIKEQGEKVIRIKIDKE